MTDREFLDYRLKTITKLREKFYKEFGQYEGEDALALLKIINEEMIEMERHLNKRYR